MAASGVPSHLDMSGPASTTGVWLHPTDLVLVITVLPHEVVPVTVRVAVNEALGTEGVK